MKERLKIAAFILALVCFLFVMRDQWESCSEHRGVFVRGVFWFQCIEVSNR